MANDAKTQSGASHSLRSAASYTQIVDDILTDIAEGHLAPGDRLASEVQLRDRYDMGISTVKRGLDELARRGVLVRKRGSGTYVAEPTEPTPVRVRRDTVAIMRQWERRSYHPYFSEVERGIRDGLAHRGWRAMNLEPWEERRWVPGEEMAYRRLHAPAVDRELAAHPETMGLIALEGSEGIVADLAADLPMVCTSAGHDRPWVAYDWDAEFTRLVGMAIRDGARRIALFGTRPDAVMMGWVAEAQHICRVAPTEMTVDLCHIESTKRWSELMSAAYNRAIAAFAASDGTPPDAIIVTSDCEAQGVADALARQPREYWRDVKIYLQCSKANQLQIPFPYTALVADGFLLGESLVELLYGRMTEPSCSPQHIRLTCQEVGYGE